MVVGVSLRKERSSVSRQFVAASSIQLRVLCDRRLEDLHLVVLMIDGIHSGGQVLEVALGIAESGQKHVLGSVASSHGHGGEDLVDRGLDLKRRYLVVIDGSKVRRAGVERGCTSASAALPDTQVGECAEAPARELPERL